MGEVRMPCIPWGNVDYFDNQISTQTHFKEAVRLANNFLYAPEKEDRISISDIEDFLDDQPNENEVWLLHRMQRAFFPYMRKATLKKYVQQGMQIPYGLRYVFSNLPKYLQAFEALLLISPVVVEGGLYVDCDALCRDPWSDTALCAYWADKRLRAASEALGGATELRMTATFNDTPLQRELKNLGYFCFEVDEKAGEYHFSKVLEPRARKHVFAEIRKKTKDRKKF